jgi:small subunit ribosomal protein S8
MMTDPIADMLTRIRNALLMEKQEVSMPGSRIKHSVAEILKQEGYILDYRLEKEKEKATLHIQLKYGPDGRSSIQDLQRVSRPGRRVYAARDDIPKVLDGLGIAILSTSKGLMADWRCREEGVGGEILCNIW